MRLQENCVLPKRDLLSPASTQVLKWWIRGPLMGSYIDSVGNPSILFTLWGPRGPLGFHVSRRQGLELGVLRFRWDL